MSQLIASAEAPSNIALIKYMGKIDGGPKNIPTNSSISVTLPELRTRVEVYESDDSFDRWEPLVQEGWNAPVLSEQGQQRFLNHWRFLMTELEMEGHFVVKSANNFPSDCGLASSASSFAALTLAARDLYPKRKEYLKLPPTLYWAQLSRQGSGSSCRSLFYPLALWHREDIEEVKSPFGDLIHHSIVLDVEKKEVSSSEAHKRVLTSPQFEGRVERAERRMQNLLLSFKDHNWQAAHEIIWAEFLDMHALFETSRPPFQYMTDDSRAVLEEIEGHWRQYQDGPWVTMDAGANIHLLFRPDQQELSERWKTKWQDRRKR